MQKVVFFILSLTFHERTPLTSQNTAYVLKDGAIPVKFSSVEFLLNCRCFYLLALKIKKTLQTNILEQNDNIILIWDNGTKDSHLFRPDILFFIHKLWRSKYSFKGLICRIYFILTVRRSDCIIQTVDSVILISSLSLCNLQCHCLLHRFHYHHVIHSCFH